MGLEEEEVVVVVVMALLVFVVCCVVVAARMFAGLRRRATTKARTTGRRRGLKAEPKEEDAMGGRGRREGIARVAIAAVGSRIRAVWDGLGRDGARAQEDSPTTRPIGANLDKVSDGWLCVETTLAATVTASQPTRAAQHIKVLGVARFGCCAR